MSANHLNIAMQDHNPARDETAGTTLPVRQPLRLHIYFIAFSLAAVLALFTASECGSITHLPSLVYGAVFWGWWGIVFSALWKLGEKRPQITRFTVKTLSIHVPVAAVLAAVHLVLLWSLGFPFGWGPGQTAASSARSLLNLDHLNRSGIEILIYGFVFGVIGIMQYQARAQQEAMKSLELQRQLSAAQLRALQMQLEPHFLFNTLNAITTLVELGRQKEAAEMLSHLNAILKSTLKRTTPEKVPLSQELEMVENYLAIEQVRFADRLRIEIKVEPGALDSLVPCFLLQPIVENAIRHGIAHCENEGLVEVSARRDGNLLRLEVRDSGRGQNGHFKRGPQPIGSASGYGSSGNGIGLKNTRERLAHFYQDAFEMKAQSLDQGGFEVAIAIPYERN